MMDSSDSLKTASLVPNKKRRVSTSPRSSRDSFMRDANDETVAKRSRVRRYCPETVHWRLACEWSACRIVFTCVDDYLAHISGEHLSEPVVSCKWRECDFDPFEDAETCARHVLFHAFHSKLKQIGSEVLITLAQQRDDASGHVQNETKCQLDEQSRNMIPELPYQFECNWAGCKYRDDNAELFYRHIRSEHVESHICTATGKCLWINCEQPLPNRNRLVEHIRHHTQEKLVACPVCGALFASFSKFIDHCSRSSEIANVCYQCTHCNKKFATAALLKEHFRKHINKCKCPICDMCCIDKNDLSKHILYKHTTHKAFKCTSCEYTCKSQIDLTKHMNTKHNNERFEYQCDECAFKTKELSAIKRHMLNLHLSEDEVLGSAYMCHLCSKVYALANTLSKHLLKVHELQRLPGHCRFRYKLDTNDGFYRLHTERFDVIDSAEQSNKDAAFSAIINTISEIDANSAVNVNNTVACTSKEACMTPMYNNEQSTMQPFSNQNSNSSFQMLLDAVDVQAHQTRVVFPPVNTNNQLMYNSVTYLTNRQQPQSDTFDTIRPLTSVAQPTYDNDTDVIVQQEDGVSFHNLILVTPASQNKVVPGISTGEDTGVAQPETITGDRIDFDLQNFFSANFNSASTTDVSQAVNKSTDEAKTSKTADERSLFRSFPFSEFDENTNHKVSDPNQNTNFTMNTNSLI